MKKNKDINYGKLGFIAVFIILFSVMVICGASILKSDRTIKENNALTQKNNTEIEAIQAENEEYKNIIGGSDDTTFKKQVEDKAIIAGYAYPDDIIFHDTNR
jgi:hypothetical protein